MAKKEDNAPKVLEIQNKKASHDYFIGETFEAGIVLKGTEIKSIRQGKAQIKDAFVRIEKNEAILYNAHISEYDFGNINNHVPVHPRKLLLHKKQILKIKGKIEAEHLAVVPLKMYMKKGFVKLLIAVCKGKKLFDKRDSLRKEHAWKEAKRELSWRR